MQEILIVIMLLLSYLIGSIPFGLIIVWLVTRQDIRTVASGRTGGTNVARAAGYPAGFTTAILDLLKSACTVSVNPMDAETMGLGDGQNVKVTTEAGSEAGELQVSDQVRKGMVLIPHGFGLIYGDTVYGLNVNKLTKNTHRDQLGTPMHRFVPCRVEAC